MHGGFGYMADDVALLTCSDDGILMMSVLWDWPTWSIVHWVIHAISIRLDPTRFQQNYK